jgi:hypothetical protein
MLFSDQEVWFKLEFKKIQVNLEDFLIDPRGFDPWHIYLREKNNMPKNWKNTIVTSLRSF